MTDAQLTVRWQLSHGKLVTKCFGPFPLAELPLWQLAHAVVALPWSNRAPAKVTVLLWQISHGALVVMCRGGLPIAVAPL